MASSEHMDEMMLAQPIRITDAASMMRRKIPKNEKPFTAEVLRCVNREVDEWYNRVLLHIADGGGCIQAGRVEGCLRYFLEGKQAISYQKYKANMIQYPEEMVMFWIEKIRDSSITELFEMGPYILSQAWQIIYTSIVNHFAEKKWEVVYSLSDNPATWDKLANANPHTMNHRPMPFGLSEDTIRELREKIDTVLKNPVTVVPQ
jgi:hypothetical protein